MNEDAEELKATPGDLWHGLLEDLTAHGVANLERATGTSEDNKFCSAVGLSFHHNYVHVGQTI